MIRCHDVSNRQYLKTSRKPRSISTEAYPYVTFIVFSSLVSSIEDLIKLGYLIHTFAKFVGSAKCYIMCACPNAVLLFAIEASIHFVGNLSKFFFGRKLSMSFC